MRPPPTDTTGLVWFRRDLRLDDHAPLHHALAGCARVHCVFVFDRDILDALPSPRDRRVAFIHASLLELDARLRALGGGLMVVHGRAVDAIPRLAAALDVATVVIARDHEPDAVRRDDAVDAALRADGRRLLRVKDQVVFAPEEVLTGAGRPYTVFTPYRTAWLRRLQALGTDAAPGTPLAPWPVATLAAGRLVPPRPAGLADGTPVHDGVPPLASIGFEPTDPAGSPIGAGARAAAALLEDFDARIGRYHEARDAPGRKGPSYLSVHLRFGTVSIRTLVHTAWRIAATRPDDADGARTWLSELVWREFYQQWLHHHPYVTDRAFRPEYDALAWERGERAAQWFDAWCGARTGYPLVDAAMRQLLATGYMHNRLRMVSASFLCKDLGIDWRLGERWFARHLNDYEAASNVGGWQWAASTGCDAQPWFRVFNPVTQSERFDPQGRFIRRHLPELAGYDDRAIHAPWRVPDAEQARLGCVIGRDYPAPIVDHAQAREQALARYGAVRGTRD